MGSERLPETRVAQDADRLSPKTAWPAGRSASGPPEPPARGGRRLWHGGSLRVANWKLQRLGRTLSGARSRNGSGHAAGSLPLLVHPGRDRRAQPGARSVYEKDGAGVLAAQRALGDRQATFATAETAPVSHLSSMPEQNSTLVGKAAGRSTTARREIGE
jgi:hypothetical protein